VKAILSIQSEVAYGHVGNSAAVLPLQRLGFEVWPVNTVQLGHHPGYGRFRGHQVDPERLAEILDAALDKAPIAACAGMIVGYLGDGRIADLAIRALSAIRAVRPDLTFLLDPVIGDDGPGVFVKPAVPSAIRERLLPAAQIVTPNRFELAFLSAKAVNDLDQAREAVANLLGRGPALVAATGLPCPDDPKMLAILAASRKESWVVRTPRIETPFSGAGDAFSALFLGHRLLAPDLKTALERAAAAMYSLIELTVKRGEAELSLVAAQDLFADPEIRFQATQLEPL
jgi:pyridoxine kinase